MGHINFHYGWIIVAVGTLCIFACLGLGRFALGMLLPSMAASLNLSYAEMGFISTGNFVGYLVAVLVSGFLVTKIGARKLIFMAMILIGSTMILSGMSQGFLYLLVIYTLTGIGSGAANVPIMALITSWFESSMRGRLPASSSSEADLPLYSQASSSRSLMKFIIRMDGESVGMS